MSDYSVALQFAKDTLTYFDDDPQIIQTSPHEAIVARDFIAMHAELVLLRAVAEAGENVLKRSDINYRGHLTQADWDVLAQALASWRSQTGGELCGK